MFFTWFVYGNLCILTEHDGIEQSLIVNNLLTYYIIVLILLGFFIYSKLIFYIIFFISFCPCITYVLCFDIHQEHNSNMRLHTLQQSLKEESLEEYTMRTGSLIEDCIICSGEFSEKEKVIALACNNK